MKLLKNLFKNLFLIVLLSVALPSLNSCGKDYEMIGEEEYLGPSDDKADQYILEYNQIIANISGKFAEMKNCAEGPYKDSLREEIEYLQKRARQVRQMAANEGITIRKSSLEDRDPWSE